MNSIAKWIDYDTSFVRQRYNRLAKFFVFFEWLFLLPPGILGKLLYPFVVWMSKLTVLGNPNVRPWDDLRELTGDVEYEEAQFGTYYICRARKH